MKRAFLLAMFLTILLVIFAACDSNDTPPVDTDGAETSAIVTDLVDTDSVETETAHTHAWGEWSTVQEATCTEAGVSEHSCSCGEKETQIIDATGHTEVRDDIVAPTCTETGLTEGKHCAVCSEVLVAQETVAALGHTPGAEATCTTDQVCTVCGAELADAIGHSFGDWYTTKEATETEKGEFRRDCTKCGEFEVTAIAELNHNHNKWDVIILEGVAPTCTETGLTEGKKCSGCGELLVSQEVISATGHSFGNWYTIKDPTETEKGELRRDCSKCDEFELTVVAELNHDHNRWDAITLKSVAPTCTTKGLTEGKKCSGCGEILEAQKDIPATGHTYRAVVTKPTCTKQGHTTYSCHCGDSYIDSYVDATGHSMGKWIRTQSPTCIVSGAEKRECVNCDYAETRSVAATGHNYNTVVTNPTCTQQGYTTHACHCGDSYVDNYVNALDHSLGEWIIDKEPDFYEEGRKHSTCTICQITVQEAIAPLYYSKGLDYVSNGDGTCSVGGIGTCTDTDIVIPDKAPTGDIVVAIGASAFFETDITSVDIPNTITSFGTGSFGSLRAVYYRGTLEQWCGISFSSYFVHPCREGSALYINGELVEKLVIPNTITIINDYAFWGCTSLTSVEFSNGVQQIGSGAFWFCTNLTSVDISASVTSVSKQVGPFVSCPNLTSIKVDDGNKVYHSIDNCLIQTNRKTLIAGCKTSIIPTDGSVTSIGSRSFEGSGVTSITIPDSVTSIGSSAFSNCTDLSTVVISGGVTSIDDYAFIHCSSLTSIILPDCLTKIGIYAFGHCSSLKFIVIPDGVTSISSCAFMGCSGLTSIIISDSLSEIRSAAFSDCVGLSSIIIPDTVTSIGDRAFLNCSGLTSIFYEGTQDEWESIQKGAGWDSQTGNYTMYFKPFMWDVDKSVVTYLSFDYLEKYRGGQKIGDVFTPGSSAGWNKILDLEDFSVDYLCFRGWLGAKGQIGQFGYQINHGIAEYDKAFATYTEQMCIDAALSTGADTGSRMAVFINLLGLKGSNNIRVLYKNASGNEVCLAEFMVKLPD